MTKIDELLERVMALRIIDSYYRDDVCYECTSFIKFHPEDRDALVAAVRELQHQLELSQLLAVDQHITISKLEQQLTIERQDISALRRKIGDMEGWPE